MAEPTEKEIPEKKQRKNRFRAKLERFLDEYTSVLVLKIDNVGSRQMQEIRIALRGKAELLMGKNTIVRRCINDLLEQKPALESLLPYIQGNIGFCFSKAGSNLKEIRDIICSNQKPAAAKAGAIAQKDVKIPAGITPLDPGQTNFFQAMNIATKIVKGAIEITNDVKVITGGQKVSASAVALLGKLGIKPFFFGCLCDIVYENGSVYDPKVLDLSPADLTAKFLRGVSQVAALALALHYPCAASVPHMLLNGFKHLAAIAVETNYTFPEAQRFKDYLANPSAFASAAPAAGAAPAAAAAKAPEPEPEPEEEEVAFDLFG